MLRPVALALLAAVPAAAAPLPDAERARQEVARRYGTWADPYGDASYTATADQLRVRLSERAYRFGHSAPLAKEAATFLREIDGDFVAEVRVTCPRVTDRIPKGNVCVSGALVAEDGAGNCALIRRCEDRNEQSLTQIGSWWMSAANRSGGGSGTGDSGKTSPTSLRLSRTGASVAFAYSWDGTTWQNYGTQAVGWGRRVKVGLAAENTSGLRVEVVFDRFTLTQPKP